MKTILFQLSFLCACFCSSAQIKNEGLLDMLSQQLERIQASADSMTLRIGQLEQGSALIENKLKLMYLAELREMETKVRDAFDKTDVISISATYHEVIKSIIYLHNEITRINNFIDAEKVFGIDFADQIMQTAETTLMNQWKADSIGSVQGQSEAKKNLLRMLIRNLVMNPVVTGFMRSNPVTSVAHSIINQVLFMKQLNSWKWGEDGYGGIFPPDYREFKNNYSEIRERWSKGSLWVRLPAHPKENDGAIEEFTNKLRPMIRLFDNLSSINERYAASLRVFMKACEQTIDRVRPLENAFYQKLGVSDRVTAGRRINDFFNVGKDPGLEILENRLNDPPMKELLIFSDQVKEGQLLLRNDFLKIITLEIELSNEYLLFFDQLLHHEQNGLPEIQNRDAIELRIKQFSQLTQSLAVQREELESINCIE